MGAGFPAAYSGEPYQLHRAVLAARADGADLAVGDVIAYKRAALDGLSGLQPTTYSMKNFMGVVRHAVAHGEHSDTALVSGGITRAKFLGHASASAGTYATWVPGKDYLTYSAVRTNVLLLEAATTVAESLKKVLILPVQEEGGALFSQHWSNPANAGATAVRAAAAASNTEATVWTTDITNPPHPRNLTITPGGTTANVAAGDITVEGTDIFDQEISEKFAFEAEASTPTTGNKAFKTVTKITVPQQDGTGVTFSVGTGLKLGLNRCLGANTILAAALNNVREATAPTVVVHATNVSSNTVQLNSTLNGNAVQVWGIDHL